jgi:hypothetical protein
VLHVKFEGGLSISVWRNRKTLDHKKWGSKPMSFEKGKKFINLSKQEFQLLLLTQWKKAFMSAFQHLRGQ